VNEHRAELIGRRIGHIRIIEYLGAGGVGSVYVGRDEKLGRRVAVKMLHHSKRLDPEHQKRFLREAQILSQLHHPNICQIFDYVEDDQRQFLVLELIDGQNLYGFISTNPTSTDSVRIAQQICDALIAAHELDIVHRDLKPANVMLTHDSTVKLLDFGLARTTSSEIQVLEHTPDPPVQPLTSPPSEDTLQHNVTELGMVLGTLTYMSPEQARGERITAASDMYSFGLILQELFTGVPPYEKGLSAVQRLNQAREGKTVPLTGVSGELATLINRLKSLAPGARPSAVDVAQYLRRIRTAGRRKLKKLALVAGFVFITCVALGMSYQAYRIGQANERARREAETAHQVTSFLVNLFKVSDPSEARGSSVTARELLDAGAEQIQHSLEHQPLVQAQLMATMGTVYQKLGLYPQAEELLERALTTQQQHPDETLAALPDTLISLGANNVQLGRLDQAQQVYQRALGVLESSLGTDHPRYAHALAGYATTLLLKADYTQAIELLEHALTIQEAAKPAVDKELIVTLNALAVAHAQQGDLKKAQTYFQRVVEVGKRVLPPDHPDLAVYLSNLAANHQVLGEYQQAIPLFEEALAIQEKVLEPLHPKNAYPLSNLGLVNAKLGNYATAIDQLQRALEIRETSLGHQHPLLAITLNNLAIVHLERGRPAAASPLLKRALALQQAHADTPDAIMAMTLNNLGTVSRYLGEYSQALSLLNQALDVRRSLLPADHPDIAFTLQGIAQVKLEQGELEQARELARQAIALQEGRLGATHPDLVPSLEILARTYLEDGAPGLALHPLRRAQTILDRVWEGRDNPSAARVLVDLGRAELGRARTDEARPVLERARAVFYHRSTSDPETVSDLCGLLSANYWLGMLYQETSDPDHATDSWEQVITVYETLNQPLENEYTDLYVQALAHLGRHKLAQRLGAKLLASGYTSRRLQRALKS